MVNEPRSAPVAPRVGPVWVAIQVNCEGRARGLTTQRRSVMGPALGWDDALS